LSIHEDAQLWRERYRVLFDKNVAGAILTTPEGRIVDCNERCARILGFSSKSQMLAHTAWDFYFDRADREILLDQLQKRRDCPAEEVVLRHSSGTPIWVLATRSVVSPAYGHPELLQGTLIDISPPKSAYSSLDGIRDSTALSEATDGEHAEIANLSQRLTILLGRASRALQPDNLPQMGRPEIKEFFLVLEEMKMLMSQLEVLRFFRE
jgi:PAS domain S-box-containing protein